MTMCSQCSSSAWYSVLAAMLRPHSSLCRASLTATIMLVVYKLCLHVGAEAGGGPVCVGGGGGQAGNLLDLMGQPGAAGVVSRALTMTRQGTKGEGGRGVQGGGGGSDERGQGYILRRAGRWVGQPISISENGFCTQCQQWQFMQETAYIPLFNTAMQSFCSCPSWFCFCWWMCC